MRNIFVGWLVAAVAVSACGETSRKPKPQPSAGTGGDAAGEGGQVLGGAGDSLGGSVSAEAGSDAGGGGGEGGAALEPLPDHSLTLVPSLPAPTTDLSPEVRDDDEITFGMSPVAVSADGSLVLGISTAIFRHLTGPISYKRQELAYWSAATGTRPIPLPQSDPNSPTYEGFCLAEDGSSALISSGQSLAGVAPATTRLIPGNAATLLVPSDVPGAGLQSCSADAKRASFNGALGGEQARAAYWQEADGAALGAITLPDAQVISSNLLLSLDATGGVLNAYHDVDDDVTPTIYRFGPDGDTEPVPSPDGARCFAEVISADGAVIAGQCGGPGITSGAFRWTAASGIKLLDENSMLSGMSRDGSTLLGRQPDDTRPMYNVLFAWRGDAAAQVIDMGDIDWGVISLSDDGSIAYLQVALDALKWTPGADLTPLPKLPEHPRARVLAASQDGSLAVGLNAKAGEPVDDGVAVLWDEQGPRDIVAELVAGQVDLMGANSFVPQRVWPGSPIRIFGECLQPDTDHKQIWFAELPAR